MSDLFAPMPRFAVAAALAAGVGFSTSVAVAAGPSTVRNAVSAQTQAERNAARAQRDVQQLDDETQEMIGEYRAAIAEAQSLRRYIESLEDNVNGQRELIAELEGDIQRIDATNREIVPLMERMVDTLERFVELDMPFRVQERQDKINELRTNLASSSFTTGDKYRQILEVYQTELGYGRSISDYRAELGDTGRQVDFLRIGRVALMYQTPDGDETGFWNKDAGEWQQAPDMRRAVQDGLAIARKQSPPEMMLTKLPAPEEAN